MRCNMTFWSCDVTVTNVASNDAKVIIYGTIAFVRSRQVQGDAASPFVHTMPLRPTSASHNADGIISGTHAFLRSRLSK